MRDFYSYLSFPAGDGLDCFQISFPLKLLMKVYRRQAVLTIVNTVTARDSRGHKSRTSCFGKRWYIGWLCTNRTKTQAKHVNPSDFCNLKLNIRLKILILEIYNGNLVAYEVLPKRFSDSAGELLQRGCNRCTTLLSSLKQWINYLIFPYFLLHITLKPYPRCHFLCEDMNKETAKVYRNFTRN